MQPTVTRGTDDKVVDQLKRIALNFSSKPIFIPCYAKENGRKPPVKMAFPPKTPLKEKVQMPTALDTFSTMDILSIYLGDDVIALDIDGKEAMNIFKDVLLKNLGKLPETLYVTSDPVDNTRGAYFFKIPQNYKGKIEHHSQKIGENGDKLEFRTGDHYQAIAGLHPTGCYHSPNFGDFNYGKLPELPRDWCDYIINCRVVSSEARKENSDAITTNKLISLRGLLDLLDALETSQVSYEDYDTWIRVGMIYHAIDDSETGLEAWIEWSSQAENVAQQKVFEEKWKSFNSDSRRGIRIGSVFYWLNQKVQSSDVSQDQKQEIQQKIADARKYITPKAWAEDVLMFVRALKEDGIFGDDLSNAIENFTLEAYGNLNENTLELVWKKYHSLDGGVTPEEKDAYTKSLLNGVLRTSSNLDDFMNDCSIIQIIKSYFEDQALSLYYPIGIMSFLTCCASVLPKGLSMNFNQDFCRPPIIYSIIVGRPSDGKNAISNIFKSPLEAATLKQHAAWIESSEKWESDKDAFRNMSKKEKENFTQIWRLENSISDGETLGIKELFPEPEKSKVYALNTFTLEAVRTVSGEQKDSGCLVAPSEISGVLAKQASYQGAGGSSPIPSMSEYVTAWDGDSTLSHVMGDRRRKADKYQLSMLTTIQPKVFDGLFSIDDPDGFLSRCMFLSVDVPIRHKQNDDPDNPDVQNISPLLWAFYQDLILKFKDVSWTNPMEMKFTVEAKSVYNQFMTWCNDTAESLEGSSDGFRAFIRRMPAKMASVLCVMNAIRYQEGVVENISRVDLRTTLEAIKFAKIILDYAQRIYKINLSIDYDLIDPVKLNIYQRIVELLKRRQGKMSLRVLCTQQWRTQPEVITVFNTSKKFKKSLQVEDMLAIVQEMVNIGWVFYDPKTKTIRLNIDRLNETTTSVEIPIKLEVKV